MLWLSWDELRENLEDAVGLMAEYDKEDQTFVFDDLVQVFTKLKAAMDRAIHHSHIEDLETQ